MHQALPWSRRELWKRKLLYPGHTFPTAAAPVMVAVGLAVHDHVFAAIPALLAFLAGWLIQVGGVFTDNYENLIRAPDDREHPELVQALKVGTLSLSELKTTIWTCYLLATLAGAYLYHVAGMPVVAIGLLSIGASWLYSAGPFPFGRHGIADPVFFVFFGIVSVTASYFVQAAAHQPGLVFQALPLAAFALSLPLGALTTNILIIDDVRDREFDAAKGKNTIAVRFGKEWSRAEFLLLLALSYGVLFWFWLGLGFNGWVLLPLLTLPFAMAIARSVCKLDRYQDLVPMTPKAAQLLLGYSGLLAIGVALA